jgi:hypothetical protein
MDTVDIGISNSLAAKFISHYLSQKGPAISMFNPENGRIVKKIKGYRIVQSCNLDGHSVMFGYDKYFQNVPPACLIFHCSHFRDYSDLVRWLTPIFGPYISDLYEAEIRRIDLCVDLSVGMESIAKAIHCPLTKNHDQRKSAGGRRTLNFGGGKRQVVVYEKDVPIDCLDDCDDCNDAEDPSEQVVGTRIEIRLKGNHRPIQKFGEFPKLKSLQNPFSKIKFSELNTVIPNGLDHRTRRNLLAYMHLAEQEGATMARQEFNRDGNFDRTIGKYLKVFQLDLAAAWKRRVDRFFRESPARFSEPSWPADIPALTDDDLPPDCEDWGSENIPWN